MAVKRYAVMTTRRDLEGSADFCTFQSLRRRGDATGQYLTGTLEEARRLQATLSSMHGDEHEYLIVQVF